MKPRDSWLSYFWIGGMNLLKILKMMCHRLGWIVWFSNRSWSALWLKLIGRWKALLLLIWKGLFIMLIMIRWELCLLNCLIVEFNSSLIVVKLFWNLLGSVRHFQMSLLVIKKPYNCFWPCIDISKEMMWQCKLLKKKPKSKTLEKYHKLSIISHRKHKDRNIKMWENKNIPVTHSIWLSSSKCNWLINYWVIIK